MQKNENIEVISIKDFVLFIKPDAETLTEAFLLEDNKRSEEIFEIFKQAIEDASSKSDVIAIIFKNNELLPTEKVFLIFKYGYISARGDSFGKMLEMILQ